MIKVLNRINPTILSVFIIQILNRHCIIDYGSISMYTRRNDASLTPSLEHEPVEAHCILNILRAILKLQHTYTLDMSSLTPFPPSLFFSQRARVRSPPRHGS